MASRHEIATWRFEQIAPLLDASLDKGRRREVLRERVRRKIEWPLSEGARLAGKSVKVAPVPRSTLQRWVKLFWRGGYEALLPKRRGDRGRPRIEGTETWIAYAVALLYEQPERSLTQLDLYLRVQFEGYALSRATLGRHLVAHPAYAGARRLRTGTSKRLRARYETAHPHECWQLDGKGKFSVRLSDGSVVRVRVLSILDDFSRAILACVVAKEEDLEATVRVLRLAIERWGLADRMQYDRGSAFDSHGVRQGLAVLGVHRNFVRVRDPEADGKIEAYHRTLERWFVVELRAQQVVDLAHLEQLLQAMVALLYNRHHHRVIGTTPEQRLGGVISSRRVDAKTLSEAFYLAANARSHPKTGEVRLPNGRFRVPRPHAGRRATFLYDPAGPGAALETQDGERLALAPFEPRPLPAARTPARGTGQLQKLLDLHQGRVRPLAQPGFGLPEVFEQLALLLGRPFPRSEREAETVLAFYRVHGPVARAPFEEACRRTRSALGVGRPLKNYLADLERQIRASPENPETEA